MATIKHTSLGQSKPGQREWIDMTLVGSGRSLLAGLLADFLNKGRRRSFPQQRRGSKAGKDSSRRYRVSGWSVTPETASAAPWKQPWFAVWRALSPGVGVPGFFPSVAGFLGQPAAQCGCTASWAKISVEGSSEEMESPRGARALRFLGGQSEKGGIALHQMTLALPTEAVGRKRRARERLLSSLLV